jgi:hypothetical protein
MRVRWNVMGVLAVVAAAVGCGSSSTGPKKPSGANAALAVHLDSLQQQAADSGEEGRFEYLTYPIAALAENVTPASISLSVNGTGQPYSAVGVEIVGTTAGASPTPSDSVLIFVAWSDSNATDIVFIEAAVPTGSSAQDTIEDTEFLTGATINSNATVTSLSASVNSVGGACISTTLPFAASNDLVSGTTCTMASLSYQFAMSFTNPSSTFSFGTSSLPSARIVVPATGGQLHIPGRLAAALRRQLQPK